MIIEPSGTRRSVNTVFLLHFIEIILMERLDICCAKLSEQMNLRIFICSCRFVISSCFSKGQITFLSACFEKNLQDAHIRYIGHGHTVRSTYNK